MIIDHSRQAQEHEYYSLADVGQHFHEVFDGGMRFLRDVGLHILLHHNPTKHDAVTKRYEK